MATKRGDRWINRDSFEAEALSGFRGTALGSGRFALDEWQYYRYRDEQEGAAQGVLSLRLSGPSGFYPAVFALYGPGAIHIMTVEQDAEFVNNSCVVLLEVPRGPALQAGEYVVRAEIGDHPQVDFTLGIR